MTLLLGVSPSIAIPSDIVGSITMRATTSLLNIRLGRVPRKILVPLVTGQILGLCLSATFLRYARLSNNELNLTLGVTLSLIGSALALKEFVNSKSERDHPLAITSLLLLAGGAISAVTVAFTSVGGGVITYLAVAIAFPRLDSKSLIAIDATAGLVLSVLASIETIATGRGDATYMSLIGVGGLIGCLGGERIKERISSHLLKEMIALTIGTIGVVYLIKSDALALASIVSVGFVAVLLIRRGNPLIRTFDDHGER